MDIAPKKSGGPETMPALQPSHAQVEAMMSQFLANLDRFLPGYAALGLRQRPTDDQKKAIAVFKGIGTGLATRDFTTILAYLPSRGDDNKLKVDVPGHAVKARVYSTSGVKLYDVRPCDVLVIDDPWDWVARIEFIDAKGVVIDATGSEAPQRHHHSPPPRAY